MINRKTKQQHLFSNGDQVYVQQTLLLEDKVVLANSQESRLELLNLQDSTKHQIDCPFSRELNEVLSLPDQGVIALRTDSLCILDRRNWETQTVVKPAKIPMKNSSFPKFQTINALLHRDENSLIGLSSDNTATVVPLQRSWKKNLEKANHYMSLNQ